MKIAIQAADLDSDRIDGTRVYLLNMLRHFGKIAPNDDFFIYHKKDFNSELAPPIFLNYRIRKIPFPFFWTQIRFSFDLLASSYDRLWMPMQAIPFIKKNKLRTTVTIHDLAFKYFPQFFPIKDLRRLNLFTDLAVRKSDKIIAVSGSTKNDILKFYPEIKEEKIKVIHHGFDPELFQGMLSNEEKNLTLSKFKIQNSKFILYVGALQPRKNLEKLVKAFEVVRDNNHDMKLVLAGDKAWMWEGIMDKISKNRYSSDIIVTGTIPFEDLAVLYRKATVFVFPSLYEGFGIPILEAQAAGVPVITSDNSSMPEITISPRAKLLEKTESLYDSALLVDPADSKKIAEAILKVISDNNLRENLIARGYENIKRFSWDKCAQETLEWIKD